MKVKLRKTGNSYTLTVPRSFIDLLNLKNGQEMEVISRNGALEYRSGRPAPKTIDWKDYSVNNGAYAKLDPAKYVEELRSDDRT